MPKAQDLSGVRFGRIVVVSKFGKKSGHIAWNCLCDCGKEKVFLGVNLTSGKSQSCGCLRAEVTSQRSLKHGNRRGNGKTSREYEAWCSMVGRCETETDTNYHNYGARGIAVCDRWRSSFENFLADMGKRPSSRHSIDRTNVNGDYTPDNCRWATKEEQMRNRRLLSNNNSGVNGVYLNKALNKYHAQIYSNGKKKHLGYFTSLEDAEKAREIAEALLWKTSD
jgi:hypothetical protein